jgi:hypothetical protein
MIRSLPDIRRIGLKKSLPVILMIFLFTACGVPVAQPPTPSQTVAPARATTIPTEVFMPGYMKEFIELGYDKQSLDGASIYVVRDENATFFSSDLWGLKYKKSILYSLTRVYYVADGELQENFVLNDFCTETGADDKSYYCYVTWGTTINISPSNQLPQTTNFSRTMDEWIGDQSPGNYPIVRIEFDAESFNKSNDFSNIPDFYFFEDVYPPWNGKFATFKIPGIGTLLPATSVKYDALEGQ